MKRLVFLGFLLQVFGQTYYYYDTYNLYYIDYDYEQPIYVPQTKPKIVVPFQTSYVEFRLYRQNVATYTLLTYGSLQTQATLINLNMPFKIIVHGYLDNTDNLWVQTIKNQYLLNNDYNVILVDWRSLSYTFYPITTYYDQQVANFIGDFIIDMNTNLNVPYTSIHCIGHSMGAHACGMAGKRVQALTGNSISRITGLDPAGPLYLFQPSDQRLIANDATFVDVIHTDKYKLGYPFSIGNADFYPNDGRGIQPGCPFAEPSPAKLVCDHLRSGYLFAESINSNGFISSLCGNYFWYKFSQCLANPTVIMGENCPTTARGNYYLTTNSNSPFARNGVI